MALFIKKISLSPEATIWKLEGRLAGDSVRTVMKELDARGGTSGLFLDLGGVVFVDEAGLDLLRQHTLVIDAIIDCQEYVRALLRENGLQSLLAPKVG